jgi:ribosome-binding protein aMBF1 (putative translation factor)
MTLTSELHEKWLRDPEYRQEFEALEPEFALVREVIGARVRAGLTQEQLAQRMGTTQSAIARLESGRGSPSIKTLKKLASVTGSRLVVRLDGVGA